MRQRLALTFAAASLAAVLLPSPALAYERQWHAGLEAGYLGGFRGLGHGAGLGVDLGYGVRDWLDLTGTLGASYHPSSRSLIPSATVGARLAFDVLQVVPYVGVEIGAAGAFTTSGCAGSCAAPAFDLAAPFGLDYQLSRSFTIGAAGRFQLLVLRGGATPMLGAFVRAAYTWGY